MGPALQRLLKRPGSLEILRFLVGKPTGRGDHERGRRGHASAGVSEQVYTDSSGNCVHQPQFPPSEPHLASIEIPTPSRKLLLISQPSEALYQHRVVEPTARVSRSRRGLRLVHSIGDASTNLSSRPRLETQEPRLLNNGSPITEILGNENPYGPWREELWPYEQLEFESNLGSPASEVRLLDTKKYQGDLRLWGCLLEYRKRMYGSAGVVMFWKEMMKRGIQLPSQRLLGTKIWTTMLDVGFQQPWLLEEVCQYADAIWDTHHKRWPKLYSYVVCHHILAGDYEAALKWHKQLIERHAPSRRVFQYMLRQVASSGGDHRKILRSIYDGNGHRDGYDSVIPMLCQQGRFNMAYKYHAFFLTYNDVPSSFKAVESLLHFLAVYYPRKAVEAVEDLFQANVSFGPSLGKLVDSSQRIFSREIMNQAHGEILNVPAKEYNDGLGARWFATTWVSLDVAINGVHALGVTQIGPLSLQSIARREPHPKNVTSRLKQLRNLGISIGDSMFARAVESFASLNHSDFLKGLLESDQHPDQLDNLGLQKKLLYGYSQRKDWQSYSRTIAILKLASNTPQLEERNLELEVLLYNGNLEAALNSLEQMQLQRVIVKSQTIAQLIKSILRPREPGSQPSLDPSSKNYGARDDLSLAIHVLKSIMISGSFVPTTQWREIIRRLGMLGRFSDLAQLTHWLAASYGSISTQSPLCDTVPLHSYQTPADIPTSHRLHPLRNLFTPALQRAIVEWGFIHAFKPKPRHSREDQRQRPSHHSVAINQAPARFTDGITLLRQLSSRCGVHINGPSVRKAIFSRLVSYFGDDSIRSSNPLSRSSRHRLRGSLQLVARQLDVALGGSFFTAVDLEGKLRQMVSRKAKSVYRRRLARRPRDRSLLPPLRAVYVSSKSG